MTTEYDIDIPDNIMDDMATVNFTVGVGKVARLTKVYDVQVLPWTTDAQKEAFAQAMEERYGYERVDIEGQWIRLMRPETDDWADIEL